MDWLVLAGAAAEAVSQVLVVVGCGVILSRTGYLTQSAQKSISKVNLYFMTPCLLFTKIASTINWTQFKAFWPIPVFYVLFSTISWVVAKAGSRLLGFSKDEEKFVIASILFSNTNSLPMALLQSLAFSAAGDRLLRDSNDTKEDVAARGISYILFYAIFGNLVRWSYGFTLLVPQDKEEAPGSAPTSQAPPSVLINVDGPSSSNAVTSASRPFLLPDHAARSPAVSIKSATESILMQRASTAYERIRQVLTPPLLTALIALIIGLVPALHQLFMSPQSTVYRFLVRPIEGCGAAAIPMILLCLGAQVVHFAESSPSPSSSHPEPQTVLPKRQPVLNPALVPAQQTGLGIYTPSPEELGSSSDEDRAEGPLSERRHNSRSSYGSGIANLQSGASSSATLLQFNDHERPLSKGKGTRASRHGSTSSTGTDGTSDGDSNVCYNEEARPLLRDGAMVSSDSESHYRIRWLTPVPFILFSRMIMVPVMSMPAIIFHPDSLSPILTMDPTFSLALVLLAAAPTAINMIQICHIKGFFEHQMAAVLFWSYCVFGIPCVLGWSLVGLWAAGRE
ncbi:auxin efflux carrier family protein [Entomortierella parvispora]|uniref:Auxin efflux carrier family protein n=1 Tax=Entomortierella parvispora TaxID=205924 RepID=A0A9P3HB85_9FUNG|nr:auxin efflux carrier family protein [Entomortierella parvispora]